jgi:hypothetical protein
MTPYFAEHPAAVSDFIFIAISPLKVIVDGKEISPQNTSNHPDSPSGTSVSSSRWLTIASRSS